MSTLLIKKPPMRWLFFMHIWWVRSLSSIHSSNQGDSYTELIFTLSLSIKTFKKVSFTKPYHKKWFIYCDIGKFHCTSLVIIMLLFSTYEYEYNAFLSPSIQCIIIWLWPKLFTLENAKCRILLFAFIAGLQSKYYTPCKLLSNVGSLQEA